MLEYPITSTTPSRFALSYVKRPCLLRGSVSAIVLAQMLLASSGVARADDTWTGVTSTDWFTAANWASGTVPTTGRVTVTTSANAPVINGQSAQAAYLTVGSGDGVALTGGSLTIQNGGHLNLTAAFTNTLPTVSLISGDNATVTVTGKGSKLMAVAGSGLIIGMNGTWGKGKGNLNILDGAEAIMQNIIIGSDATLVSTLKVSGSGSVLSFASAAFGDGSNTSIIEVNDGGHLTGSMMRFTNAVLTVTGIGSVVNLSSTSSKLLTVEQSRINVMNGAEFNLTGTSADYTISGKVTVDDTGSVLKDKSLTGAFILGKSDTSAGGTLTVTNGGVFQSARSLSLGEAVSGSSGTLNIGAAVGDTAVAPGSVSADGGISLFAGGILNFNHTSTDYVFSSAMSNGATTSIGVINQISGTTILTTDSSFSGTVTLTGGVLQFGNDTATGGLSSDNIITGTDVANKGTLAFGRSGTYTYDKTITGTGSVMGVGSGTTVLTANNTYSGGTVFSGGKLSVTADSKFGDAAGGLTFDGGTLQVTGTTMTSTARAITWSAGGGGFDIADAGNIFIVSQALLDGGSLTKLGAGTLVLSGTNTYAGGTELAAGILKVAADNNLGAGSGNLRFMGATLEITDTMSSARTATLTSAGGTIIVEDAKTATFSGLFADALTAKGGLTKAGGGRLMMTAQNTYTGDTTISGGVLQLGDGVTDGLIAGGVVNNASIVVNNINATALSQVISGTGSLTQQGAGTLTLSGDNIYTGVTNLNAGIVSVNQDDNLGTGVGALNFNGGTLQITGTAFDTTAHTVNWGANGGSFDIVDATHTFSLTTVFTGAGALNKLGAGALALSGDSSAFTGLATVNDGLLRLDDGALGGAVNVNNTGALGGHGTISGAATVADGGTLFGQSNQVLNFAASLSLSANSKTDVTLHGGPSTNRLFNVTGDLALNGTLNIQAGRATPIGVYRIFDYSGALTQNTMTIGSVAEGNVPDYSLQTSVNHQVNLVITGGREFFYWDGAGPKNNGIVDGGTGTWSAADDNWTDVDGQNNSAWPADTFAVFTGAAGTVTLDAGYTPSVNGMQFMTDGYVLGGGTIMLAGEGDQIIIVGDGSLNSANMTATIAAVLQGSEGLTKSGAGTLALTGANIYTGNTTVTEGTLELGDGGSIIATSNIILSSTRFGEGTLAINKTTGFTVSNQISGVGAVVQRGTGTTTFAGNNSFSGGLSVLSGTAQAGIADTAFGSGIVAIKSGATLDLANFNEKISGLVGGATGDGDITLGSGTLTLNQTQHDDFSGIISGTGGLTLSATSTSSLTLYGINTYSGATTVAGAKLIQGAQDALSGASAYSVANGTALDLGGFSTNMTALSNNGMVDFGGAGGAVLTIAGDYVGNGGTLAINTVLAGDNAVSDRLKVGGSTSGSTQLDVTNRGGLGAQTVNGIKVIDVAGQSNGTFTLNGDYLTKDGQQAIMTSSAYAYTLQKNSKADPNNGNWYLVSQNTKPDPIDPPDCKTAGNCPPPSCKTTNTCPPDPTPRYSPAAPVYESYANTLQALNKLPTLQQRVGTRYPDADFALRGAVSQNDEARKKAVWGRIEGGHTRLETASTAGFLNQDMNTFIMQTGVNGQFYEGSNGKLIGGITGQYGNAHSNITNRTGDGSGNISTQGWSLGGTLTWYGTSGLYVDGQAQTSWYDSDLNSDNTSKALTNGNKGTGYGLSIEAGQRIGVNDNWMLTPQAQLLWSSVTFSSFTDAYGANISNQNGDSLSARFGLAANYTKNWKGDDGRMVNASFYGIANLYQEFMGATKMSYADTSLATHNDRTWGGLGAGGTYAWADDKYALYGEGSINTSLNSFAKSYSIKGTIGLRVKW